MVDGEVHERVGESFVEPQVVPPRHRHYVAEPLRRTDTSSTSHVTVPRDVYWTIYGRGLIEIAGVDIAGGNRRRWTMTEWISSR